MKHFSFKQFELLVLISDTDFNTKWSRLKKLQIYLHMQ
jgi:hypothetical protein